MQARAPSKQERHSKRESKSRQQVSNEQGQTLSVDVSSIQDLDGLGAFNYQWLANGVAVQNADGPTAKRASLTLGLLTGGWMQLIMDTDPVTKPVWGSFADEFKAKPHPQCGLMINNRFEFERRQNRVPIFNS